MSPSPGPPLRRLLLGLTLLSAIASKALAVEPAFPDDLGFEADSHEQYGRRVDQAGAVEYARALQGYSEHLASHPDDTTAAIERCRFIDRFADLDDPSFESVFEDQERCLESLESGAHSGHPEVQLYLLERSWGGDAIETGEALVQQASNWSSRQRGRLHTALAHLYAPTAPDVAGEHAVAAVELDPASDARILAAEFLARRGASRHARDLITTAPVELWARMPVKSAAELLLRLGATAEAISLLQAHAEATFGTDGLLARALAQHGDVEKAREVYESTPALESEIWNRSGLRERFEFECQYGSAEQANAAYARLRDTGIGADPLARLRLGLWVRHPSLPWTGRDLLGLLTLLATGVGLALSPLLLIGPVHYRGLVRRVKGTALAPATTPWGLGAAWYLMGATLITGAVVEFILAYPQIEGMLGLPNHIPPSLPAKVPLGTMFMCIVTLRLAVCVPLVRRVRLSQLFHGNWSWKRSVLSGASVALGLRIVGNLVARFVDVSGLCATIHVDRTTEVMRSLAAENGAWALIGVVVVLAPIAEEFLFRGVVLSALAQHVSFTAAAATQALLFALVHDNWGAMPFLLALGLLAALLYRRSQGLLAPIALHAASNLLAAIGTLAR